MTVVLAVLILASPLAVAAVFARAAHHSSRAAPMAGRLFEDDRDRLRVEHDVDAIRTRFERQPAWPSSSALGERR
jgi:hypothetical protein